MTSFALAGTDVFVAVGGTGVLVGGIGVSVGGTGVSVGGIGVSVGGTGVSVGGTGVLVGGTGVLVAVGVLLGGTGVNVGVGVLLGGIGVSVASLPTIAVGVAVVPRCKNNVGPAVLVTLSTGSVIITLTPVDHSLRRVDSNLGPPV